MQRGLVCSPLEGTAVKRSQSSSWRRGASLPHHRDWLAARKHNALLLSSGPACWRAAGRAPGAGAGEGSFGGEELARVRAQAKRLSSLFYAADPPPSADQQQQHTPGQEANPHILRNLPLWRVQWAVVPGKQTRQQRCASACAALLGGAPVMVHLGRLQDLSLPFSRTLQSPRVGSVVHWLACARHEVAEAARFRRLPQRASPCSCCAPASLRAPAPPSLASHATTSRRSKHTARARATLLSHV